MSKPWLHILVELQSSSMVRGPACAVISALSEKQETYLQMKRSSFLRFISSRVYTAAVIVAHWRENEYIACYFVLGPWGIGKTSHLLLTTKGAAGNICWRGER